MTPKTPNTYPKTRQGLIQLIISQLARTPTTYVSFCSELEKAKDDPLDWYCNSHCQIHKLHNSHQLLCIPANSQKLLQQKIEGMEGKKQ